MIAAPVLSFDAEKHEYRLGDEKLPSVTQIISAVIERRFSPGDWYLQRGRAIHHAIHLLANNQLDWSTVDERIKPRLDALHKFLAETGLQILESEMQLASQSMRYAGTLDSLLGKHEADNAILGDWKSSLEASVELQLGAYSLLLNEKGGVKTACAIELKDNGNYNCRWFKGPDMRRAEQSFKAVLSTYNWMRRNKLLPKKEEA